VSEPKNNPDDPVRPEKPSKEPFDVWWPKYVDSVNESVEAAEQYLEVPAGTISSIRTEPDFIAVVKAYAVVEPMLNDLIVAVRPRRTPIFGGLAAALAYTEPADEGFQAFVAGLNIGGRVGKVALAKGLGLLRQDQVRFIEGIARLRNRYAHNVRNMHRSFVDILTEEQENNAKIVEHITGLMDTKLPAPKIAPYLKMFMYHRLADFLSDALKTLRPPPLPPGGLFGILNAVEAPDSAHIVGGENT
jgi:hypothetical protein